MDQGRHRPAVAAALSALIGFVGAALTGFVGCTQPTDCAAEPERCPGAKADHGAAQGAVQANIAREKLRAGAEIEARTARIGDLAPPEQDHRTPEGLIRRIRNVAANHNLPGLKRFMTVGFGERVDTMMKETPERFIDRYVNAAEHGFELTSSPGPRTGTLELQVKGRDEMTLRPIVERSDRGWLFDRF